jgi:uncharacterized protein (DUF1499 family)
MITTDGATGRLPMTCKVLLTSILVCATICCCIAPRPKNLGIKDNSLAPCPRSPNCVATQSPDSMHAMPCLTYTGSQDSAMDRLVRVVTSMKRTKIITQTGSYLYVQFTTALMRYVDDVEFRFDDAKKTIDFRSASRIGYSDMGVNRKRMSDVTQRFMSGR